jgi:hypothetical protein
MLGLPRFPQSAREKLAWLEPGRSDVTTTRHAGRGTRDAEEKQCCEDHVIALLLEALEISAMADPGK